MVSKEEEESRTCARAGGPLSLGGQIWLEHPFLCFIFLCKMHVPCTEQQGEGGRMMKWRLGRTLIKFERPKTRDPDCPNVGALSF